MEVDRLPPYKGCAAHRAQTDCRSSCSGNNRRVFRLPRRSIKDASVARFASLSLSPHKPNSGENPRKGAAAPFLVVLRGFAKGQGSHANPAKRFVWEKEEQRNGRRLSAASGGQDEGCGVCSDANPPLPFSFYRQRLFLCRAKKKGLNTALSEAFRKKLRHSGAKKPAARAAGQNARIKEEYRSTRARAWRCC